MAIELHRAPIVPVKPRRTKLRLVPSPPAERRKAEVVHVRPHPDASGWTCSCLCGWSSRRLRLPDEEQAERTAALHVRICSLLNR
jgi:hypothetical protein